jgi:hypothetical protein
MRLRPAGQERGRGIADVDARFLLRVPVERDGIPGPRRPQRGAVVVDPFLLAGQDAGRDAVAAELVDQRHVDLLAVGLQVAHAADDRRDAVGGVGIEAALTQERVGDCLLELD